MTNLPAGFPAVSPAAGSAVRADELQVAFAGPAPQRRLTVFFRLIMVIPQYVVLYFLNIAAEVVLFISWFAALFTGRVPTGMADFLAGYLRWYSRVIAYLWLLTDVYPPFALRDESYPVRIAVAPGRLNRLTVLFRLFLAIPALLLAAAAGWGIGIAAVVIWLIVLITGRMPDPLHAALAAIFRFWVRFYGYWMLLTSTYPGGLFGDQPAAGAPAPGAGWSPPAAPAEPGAPGPPQPGTTPPGFGQPGYGQPGYGQPRYGQAPAYAAAPGPLAVAAPDWRLVLPSGAKKLVAFFLGLGAAGLIAYIVVMIVVVGGSAGSRANAVSQVSRAHGSLVQKVNALQSATAACQSSLSCVTRQDSKAADAFVSFNATLQGTAMPDSASTAASQRLQQDSTRIAADFHSLSHATSASQYQQTLASSGLQQTLAQFDAHYQQLGVALGVRG